MPLLSPDSRFFKGDPTRQKTYDYTLTNRRWGHDIAIDDVLQGGKKIKTTGWGTGLAKGDYVILSTALGDTTRYRISEIRYSTNVFDMFFATMKLAPRRRRETE